MQVLMFVMCDCVWSAVVYQGLHHHHHYHHQVWSLCVYQGHRHHHHRQDCWEEIVVAGQSVIVVGRRPGCHHLSIKWAEVHAVHPPGCHLSITWAEVPAAWLTHRGAVKQCDTVAVDAVPPCTRLFRRPWHCVCVLSTLRSYGMKASYMMLWLVLHSLSFIQRYQKTCQHNGGRPPRPVYQQMMTSDMNCEYEYHS